MILWKMLHAILRSEWYLMKRVVIHFLLYCTDLNKEGRPFTQWDVAEKYIQRGSDFFFEI
mgnify:CR=1 FL=1